MGRGLRPMDFGWGRTGGRDALAQIHRTIRGYGVYLGHEKKRIHDMSYNDYIAGV